MKIPIDQLAVIWVKGGRIGSIRQSELAELEKTAHLSLIQRDVSGCEHWDAWAIRKGLDKQMKKEGKGK